MSVTLKDIAIATGYSVSAVSAVLGKQNNTIRVSESVADIIRKSAVEMGYRRSHTALSLRRGRSMTIGILTGNLTSPYHSNMVSLLSQECVRCGYMVQLFMTQRETEVAKKSLDWFLNGNCDGIIFTELCSSVNDPDAIEYIRKNHFPVVYLNLDFYEFSSIIEDRATGFRQAMDYFRSRKVKKVAFIGNVDGNNYNQKLDAFRQCCQQFDLEYELYSAGDSPEPAFECMRNFKITSDSPRVIFTENEIVAQAVLHAFRLTGISVPEDIAVVAYDRTNYYLHSHPALASIYFDMPMMAKRGVAMLLERIENPKIPHKKETLDSHFLLDQTGII